MFVLMNAQPSPAATDKNSAMLVLFVRLSAC